MRATLTVLVLAALLGAGWWWYGPGGGAPGPDIRATAPEPAFPAASAPSAPEQAPTDDAAQIEQSTTAAPAPRQPAPAREPDLASGAASTFVAVQAPEAASAADAAQALEPPSTTLAPSTPETVATAVETPAPERTAAVPGTQAPGATATATIATGVPETGANTGSAPASEATPAVAVPDPQAPPTVTALASETSPTRVSALPPTSPALPTPISEPAPPESTSLLDRLVASARNWFTPSVPDEPESAPTPDDREDPAEPDASTARSTLARAAPGRTPDEAPAPTRTDDTSAPPEEAPRPRAATRLPMRAPAPGSPLRGSDTGAAPSATVAAPPADDVPVVVAARRFIATLTEGDLQPLSVEKADHFVTQDQVISLLPESSIETVSTDELTADPTLEPTTPITVVREIDQVEVTTPERLIAEAAGDMDAPVRIVDAEEVQATTVRALLERHAAAPEAPIFVVKRVKYFEVTTPVELARDTTQPTDQPLRVIRERYHIEAATVADLIRRQQAIEPDAIFYVRTVRDDDVQGLWGIVHDGIIGNFARGVAIRRSERVDTYQVEIPRDADELLYDRSSSFLGRLIDEKTRVSFVYNFKENRMGRNPDRVHPGQEIVIINFAPEELISIYRHFVEARG